MHPFATIARQADTPAAVLAQALPATVRVTAELLGELQGVTDEERIYQILRRHFGQIEASDMQLTYAAKDLARLVGTHCNLH